MDRTYETLLQQAEKVAPLLQARDPGRIGPPPERGLPSAETLALMLSPAAATRLQAMAAAAETMTRRHFGRVMQMYAPLYLSDHCINQCTYCGFRAGGGHARRRLEGAALLREGACLHALGYRSVLLLTGESRVHSGPAYLEEAVSALAPQFPMIGLEVYPLETEEYRRLAAAGAESLSLYQETYDRVRYSQVHPGGPKADFDYRLQGPERGCRAGLRSINLGVLLGLGDWRRDVLTLGLHGRWLQRRYPEVQIGFSLPRMRPAPASLLQPRPVTDREFIQALLALRLWMPQADLTLSTREPAPLRDALAGCCVTRMSAGSKTRVGGYGAPEGGDGDQFAVSDDRSLAAVTRALAARGLEAVTQDWLRLTEGARHA